MPPRRFSRFTFSSAVLDGDERLFLTDREPFRFQPLPFMLRYNAAHPGAEREVFPHLEKRHPAVVAYTATSWRKLLKKPRGWDGAPMTAGDCYRFCLSSPHVDVVLTGPASEAQLDENLKALDAGALSPDEDAWMRRFGQAVHG